MGHSGLSPVPSLLAGIDPEYTVDEADSSQGIKQKDKSDQTDVPPVTI
jgi:hypothetical protein